MAEGGVLPHLGRDIEFDALGKHWKMGRLTMSVWADVWKWIEPKLPDLFAPLERLADKIPPAEFMQLVAETQRRDAIMRTLESPEARALLDTIEGQVWQTYCQLRVHHPDMTPDLALDILMDLGQQKVAEMRIETEGKAPTAGKESAPAA